jgi:glycosyltransferase involved in cell wall biosynthesis
VFGNYQKYLEDLADRLGVAGRIVYAGSVPYDQVRDYLAAADVVSVPSVQDSGNKLVMEAAAVATPFVATRTAGNALWAPEWRCGLIVEPRAPEELAQALIRVLSDPAAARRMGENGLKFAQQFSPDKVAERTIWLCECALRQAPLPAELRHFDSLLHPTPPLPLTPPILP